MPDKKPKCITVRLHGDKYSCWIDDDTKDILFQVEDLRRKFREVSKSRFYSYIEKQREYANVPRNRTHYKINKKEVPHRKLISLEGAVKAIQYFKHEYIPRERSISKQVTPDEKKIMFSAFLRNLVAKRLGHLPAQPNRSLLAQPNRSLLAQPTGSLTARPTKSLSKQATSSLLAPPNKPSLRLVKPEKLFIEEIDNFDELYELHDKALKSCRKRMENLFRQIL